jgi:hypothetical protein
LAVEDFSVHDLPPIARSPAGDLHTSVDQAAICCGARFGYDRNDPARWVVRLVFLSSPSERTTPVTGVPHQWSRYAIHVRNNE